MPTRYQTLFFLTAVGIAQTSGAFAADFSYKCEEKSCKIQLKGEIVSGDAQRFSSTIEDLHHSGNRIDELRLLSKGGLVSEALKIGRIVRDLAIFTVAPQSQRYFPPLPEDLIPGSQAAKEAVLENENNSFKYFVATTLDGKRVSSSLKAVEIMTASGKSFEHDNDVMCASACALIAVSGLIRFGTVGVHHMYVDSENIDYGDLESILSQSAGDVESYLNEMRAPRSFFDDIVSTPSREMKWIDLYEIGSVDPILQEYAHGKCGGLTNKQSDDQLNLSLLAEHGRYFEIATNQVIEGPITKAESKYLKELDSISEASGKCKGELYSEAQLRAQGLD